MSADFFALGKSSPEELAAMVRNAGKRDQHDQLDKIDKLLAADEATVYSTAAHKNLREAIALLRQLVAGLVDKK